MILFFAIFCLALNGGLGAPRSAVYKFVMCNPEDGQANCIPHQSTVKWSGDLPTKLPASAARYLEAEPVEDEKAPVEEEDVAGDEEKSMASEEREMIYLPEEGSGFEGSAFMADGATAADTGSGEYLAREDYKPHKGGRKNRKGAQRFLFDEQKPAEEEMKEDHLLHP